MDAVDEFGRDEPARAAFDPALPEAPPGAFAPLSSPDVPLPPYAVLPDELAPYPPPVVRVAEAVPPDGATRST